MEKEIFENNSKIPKDKSKSYDDCVEYWHNNETGKSLQDFLGLTDDEYEAWLKMGDDVSQEPTGSNK